MHYTHLRIESDGPVTRLVIAREKALNALNSVVIAELTHAVAAFEADPGARVLILTGAGKAFVAGADIAEMVGMGREEAQAFSQRGQVLMRAIAESRKTVIAAVNGYALGGGCELAMAADILVASAKARFGQPEVKLGVVPGFGGTQRLARLVGPQRAKWLVLSGDLIKADEALAMGLVAKVVEPDALMDEVNALASRIAAAGPLAVEAGKRLVDEGLRLSLVEGLELETRAFGDLFATADQSEGMGAFVEKRAPRFEGR